MTTLDVAALEATIVGLKAQLSRARVQVEVFRTLYERQATEIDNLLAPALGEHQPASIRRHLCIVVDEARPAPDLAHKSDSHGRPQPTASLARPTHRIDAGVSGGHRLRK